MFPFRGEIEISVAQRRRSRRTGFSLTRSCNNKSTRHAENDNNLYLVSEPEQNLSRLTCHTFSFESKFIVDFYSEWNDIKAFEQAILELVLPTPPEPCTLLLEKSEKEVREYTRLYEAYSLPWREVIKGIQPIRRQLQRNHQEEMEVVNRLRKPMNEANKPHDSIGCREHVNWRRKAGGKRIWALQGWIWKGESPTGYLYEQQNPSPERSPAIHEKPLRRDIYLPAYTSWASLTKYVPDEENQPKRTKQTGRAVQTASRKLKRQPHRLQLRLPDCPEYFSMKAVPSFMKFAGEQFEDITAPDFYACMNLHPLPVRTENKAKEKIRVCYLISLMREQLPGQDKDKWKKPSWNTWILMKTITSPSTGEPVSDLPSIPNQSSPKMDGIFR